LGIVIAAELLRLIRLNFSASFFQEEVEKVKKNPDFLEGKQQPEMHKGGGDRGEGGTSCTPYKDFEKIPHKNALKTTPPLIVSQP